jgi:hypothetical protein
LLVVLVLPTSWRATVCSTAAGTKTPHYDPAHPDKNPGPQRNVGWLAPLPASPPTVELSTAPPPPGPDFYEDADGPRAWPINLASSPTAPQFGAELLQRSVLHEGSRGRLLEFWAKLGAGRPVTVVVFGGSVSAAHHLEPDAPANTPAEALRSRYAWGAQLVAWLNENHAPSAGEHALINLAYGGSGTAFAVTHQLALLEGRAVCLETHIPR